MREAYIRFMAEVNAKSTDNLIKHIDDIMRQDFSKIHLIISSPGGSVFHGLSMYNFLSGVPVEIDTYNFGSVDSIGLILFCAGKQRFCVPNARFLIHGVNLTFAEKTSLDERMLENHLKNIRIDQENIARIIALTTKKEEAFVKNDMHFKTTLTPEQAKDYGLVTEISQHLIPSNADLFTVGDFDHPMAKIAIPQ